MSEQSKPKADPEGADAVTMEEAWKALWTELARSAISSPSYFGYKRCFTEGAKWGLAYQSQRQVETKDVQVNPPAASQDPEFVKRLDAAALKENAVLSAHWPTTTQPTVTRVPHKCPVCNGSGTICRPPWISGDTPCWSSDSVGPWPCNACGGKGVLWS